MARWQTHRTDGNADRLREYLEARGASVAVIDRPVDWAVGAYGATALVEVKTPRGSLNAQQKAFLGLWRGLGRVIRTEEDCQHLLAYLKLQGAATRSVGVRP